MNGLNSLLVLVPMLLPSWLDPEKIINAAGPYALWIVVLIVFAECGLFSLLPGDSLLFTVGMFIAGAGTAAPAISYGTPVQTLLISCTILTVAAILGNIAGYFLGRLIGPPLFKPRTGFMGKVFNPHYVEQTEKFFEKYGSRALILARFVPMVRTFVTLVAGVAHMNFRKFITYTAIGGVLWVWLVTTAGYFLGKVEFVHKNLEVVIILIVFISVIPMVVEYIIARRNKGKVTPVEEVDVNA